MSAFLSTLCLIPIILVFFGAFVIALAISPLGERLGLSANEPSDQPKEGNDPLCR